MNGVKSNSSNEVSITNSNVLERLYNVTIPEEVEIFVPYVQHNKGCRKKRLICEFEKSIMKVQRRLENAQCVVKENITIIVYLSKQIC